jgi:aryl-alcohol dehydrogenase-like predicted oxidoreductase
MKCYNPRFQGGNFERNLKLAERIETLAQLALAWVLAQGDDIVPIPGTKRRKYLEENVAALNLELTPADLKAISAAAPSGAAAGLRYPEPAMQAVNC